VGIIKYKKLLKKEIKGPIVSLKKRLNYMDEIRRVMYPNRN